MLLLLTPMTPLVAKVVPINQLSLYRGGSSTPFMVEYATHSMFGPLPPMSPGGSAFGIEIIDDYLCNGNDEADGDGGGGAEFYDSVVFVPRGNCSFSEKVYRASKRGARGVVIYNDLKAMYFRRGLNTSAVNVPAADGYDFTSFPVPRLDYECDNGEAWIAKEDLNQPFWEGNEDILGSGSKCATQTGSCQSENCIVTGVFDDTTQKMKVCCAWDLKQVMHADPTVPFSSIPSVFISAQQFAMVKGAVMGNVAATIIKLEERYRPNVNVSSLLIWMLGVAVACGASYLSASELRTGIANLEHGLETKYTSVGDGSGIHSRLRKGGLKREDGFAGGETLELTGSHAIAFLVCSSAVLLGLFFFKAYSLVTVLYAFGCSNATAQIILLPLAKRINKCYSSRSNNPNNMQVSWWDEVWVTLPLDIGPCSRLEVLSVGLSYLIGIIWLTIALQKDASSYTIYWIMQDIYGAAMCVLFLGVIKLPSIRVASLLLVAAFVYDIFFVFVTPLLFSKSVMIEVATGGGGPTEDELTCEKYPDTPGCAANNPLPMLFQIVRIDDYQGGSSLLGLGDIVLPGLLLSFACRLDLSKQFVGISNDAASDDEEGANSGYAVSPNRKKRSFCRGYFPWLCLGYAVGLMSANILVYVMKQGQPALMTLVPCVLGPMIFLAHRWGELGEVWRGPRIISTADRLLFDDEDEDTEDGVIDEIYMIEEERSEADITLELNGFRGNSNSNLV